jgi:hypothetical protein
VIERYIGALDAELAAALARRRGDEALLDPDRVRDVTDRAAVALEAG